MNEIKTVEIIDSSPWEYTLYMVNGEYWVLEVPYETHRHVDTDLSLILTSDEKLLVEKNESWLKGFSEFIKCLKLMIKRS